MEPTKERIDRLIDSLTDKRRTCPACEGLSKEHGYCGCGAFLRNRHDQKPILIGDVLEKIDLRNVTKTDLLILIVNWKQCEAGKSLQEIFEGCKWRALHESTYGMRWLQARNLSTPKDPNIRALASLLLTLFPDV